MKDFILNILYYILITIICIVAIPLGIAAMIVMICLCAILVPFALIAEAFNTK